MFFFFFASTSTQYVSEPTGTPAASVDIIIVAAFFLGSSLCLSTSACLVDSSSWAFRARISASFSASCATTSSAMAPGGVGVGGDGGVASFPDASSATPWLPLLAGDASCPVRAGQRVAIPQYSSISVCGCGRIPRYQYRSIAIMIATTSPFRDE